MKTLKRTYWENCDKLIKCDFPCNSCFGCENKIKEVKEWLQQKQHTLMKNGVFYHYDTIKELLEELKK